MSSAATRQARIDGERSFNSGVPRECGPPAYSGARGPWLRGWDFAAELERTRADNTVLGEASSQPGIMSAEQFEALCRLIRTGADDSHWGFDQIKEALVSI